MRAASETRCSDFGKRLDQSLAPVRASTAQMVSSHDDCTTTQRASSSTLALALSDGVLPLQALELELELELALLALLSPTDRKSVV